MRIASIILLFITGLNALAAGYGFMADRSGRGVGISTGYLQTSPFADFLIPGIVLFGAIGICSVVVAIFALRKAGPYPDLIFMQGFIITGWILIQVLMVRDFNWMHLTVTVVGLLLIFFGRSLRGEQRRSTNGKFGLN